MLLIINLNIKIENMICPICKAQMTLIKNTDRLTCPSKHYWCTLEMNKEIIKFEEEYKKKILYGM